MTPAELDQQLRLILAQLELVSTAPTQAFNPGGGKTDDSDGAPAGAAKTPADHFRGRLAGVQTGLQRRLDAAEATGDEDQRNAEIAKAHARAHEQRETILTAAQREWKLLTGRDGEIPTQRVAAMDAPGGVDKAIEEEARGKPADDVAAKLGLTVFSVRRRYVEMGLDPVTGEALPTKGDDWRDVARELAGRRLSERQIVMVLKSRGVQASTSQVRRALGRAA